MSRGFKPQKRRQHAADGGLIRGPGTTTSDDIKTHMRPGSYILPADTTETLSANNLTRDGRLAPVAVSDGEFQLTPEQVQAVGEQVLDAVRNVTHEPVIGEGLGFGPRQHLADGGVVDEEALRRRRFYVDANGQVRPVAPGQQTGMVPAGPRTTGGMPAPAPQFNATVTNPALATGTVTPQPAGFRPLAGSVGGDYAARANAMHNRMRDTANYNASRAAQDAKFASASATPPSTQTAPTKTPLGSRARGLVNRLGPLGAATLAAPAIQAAREPDSTARYAERFGFDEPTGDGSFGDMAKFAALRGLGFASDVGSTLTGGLADTLYRDKQQINTDAIPDAGAAATGGFVGRGAGKWTGKALDKAGNIVTRGRYDGDTAEKVLSNTGLIGGAIGGVALANADGTPVVTDPTQQAIYDDGYLPEPENDGSEANNITRVGNSFSSRGPITAGYTVNGAPSSETEPLVYHAGNPAEAAAANWRAKLNLFENTPTWAGGNTAVAGAGGNTGANAALGFRPGGNTGGGPRATLIRNSGTPSNAEILRERMRGQREQLSQRGRQIDADTNLRQQQIDIQGRTADAQLEAQQAERALAMRTAARMEALRTRYENAESQEERSSIALAIRDLLGQARPQYQIATSDELIDPNRPDLGVRRTSVIIDPQTGQQVPANAGGAWPKPTAANINALRKGMATKEQFEERFGPGSANIYGA